MKISFRLAELLEERQDLGRGVIKRICSRTSLERHQVAAILNNNAKYVSLQTLAGICKYLVERHHVDPAQLPGLLFRIEPEEFSALLASRPHLEIALGIRTESAAEAGEEAGRRGPRRQWVMAADSYLHGVLLHELAGLRREGLQAPVQFMEQRLVPAFDAQWETAQVLREAQAFYDGFKQVRGDKAMVALGSVKSNIAVEMVFARAFGAEPFVSQDDVAQPQMRSCPIFFRYRDDDPAPPSCHGGLRLARGHEVSQPGIYYETADGQWQCCPSDEEHDVALVFYVYHLTLGRLEMVMGGFSGHGTLCLAAGLRHLTDRLWPPVYSRDDLMLGAFLVRFRLHEPGAEAAPAGDEPYSPAETEVIRLDEAVVARRLREG